MSAAKVSLLTKGFVVLVLVLTVLQGLPQP